MDVDTRTETQPISSKNNFHSKGKSVTLELYISGKICPCVLNVTERLNTH